MNREIIKKRIARKAWKQHLYDVRIRKIRKEYAMNHQGISRKELGLLNLSKYSPLEYNKRLRQSFDQYIKDFTPITAPENFSVVDNPEEFVNFVNKIRINFEARQKVFIVMDKIENITDEAIVVLLSNMIRFREENIDFNGNKPLKKDVRRKLVASGFFRLLYSKKEGNEYSVQNIKNTIYTHAHKRVDSRMATKLVEAASEFLWNEKRRCPGVRNSFMELMSNTFKHSSDSNRKHHWWVSMAKDYEKRTVTFGFVDYGLGVFRSLKNKKPDDNLYGALERLLSRFPWIKSDAETMKLILEGELHRTITQKRNHGKGLPSLYQCMQRNDFDNLVIITNYVYVNVKKGKYIMLNTEFLGTFVSWELTPSIMSLNNTTI